ncbi:MAG TPA: BamA/TamA family outer membrane protein [Kofleriaceae bacterium]|nr:BamA/TamA family outer membrane protein [Kofleriaceae bacterium]
MLLVLACVPAAAQADSFDIAATAAQAEPRVVVGFRAQGNTKLRDRTLSYLTHVKTGELVGASDIPRIVQALVSSELFKKVDVTLEDAPGGVVVVATLEDKHSWVVAPTLYFLAGARAFGFGFAENNLFGENKKLLLYGQVATGDSFLVAAYVDPSIAGTRLRWQGDLFLKYGRVIEYASPVKYWRDDPRPLRISRLTYLNAGLRVGTELWKGVTLDGRLRGAKVGYSKLEIADGATLEEITGDPASTAIPAPGAEGWDVSGEVALGIDTRANWYGISSGYRFVATFEHALPGLGSDFEYWYSGVQLQRAIRFLSRHNLVLKSSFGYGKDMPFQQEYVAGGTSQRGWKNNQFHGDLRVTANAEYSVPIVTIKGLAIRGITFWDSSYLTFRNPDEAAAQRDYLPGADVRGSAPLRNSVGVGTRLYLRQIVLPLLGLDFGYGVERGDYEIYLAIGLTD